MVMSKDNPVTIPMLVEEPPTQAKLSTMISRKKSS